MFCGASTTATVVHTNEGLGTGLTRWGQRKVIGAGLHRHISTWLSASADIVGVDTKMRSRIIWSLRTHAISRHCRSDWVHSLDRVVDADTQLIAIDTLRCATDASSIEVAKQSVAADPCAPPVRRSALLSNGTAL